jgi:hypothetical protein
VPRSSHHAPTVGSAITSNKDSMMAATCNLLHCDSSQGLNPVEPEQALGSNCSDVYLGDHMYSAPLASAGCCLQALRL